MSNSLVVPAVLATALAAFLGFWITQGLKSLSQILAKSKWLAWIDMSGWGSWLTSFVVGAILFYANAALGYVPANDISLVSTLLTIIAPLLAQVLTSNGIHYVLTGPPSAPVKAV
jgi:hypothetical protein